MEGKEQHPCGATQGERQTLGLECLGLAPVALGKRCVLWGSDLSSQFLSVGQGK